MSQERRTGLYDRRRFSRGGRRATDPGQLRDPETCPACPPDTRTRVIDRSEGKGYIRRRHRCVRCGARWTSYQYLAPPSAIDRADLDPGILIPY